MSVLVVTRVRARPGGETTLIAAAVRSFQAPAAGRAGEAAAPRLFQGYDDPQRFYWVTRWADAELYLAGVPAGMADEWLNEVCEDEMERAFFTALDAPAAPAAMAGGALIVFDAASARTRAAGEQLLGQLRAEPAVSAVALYPGREDPGQYLALCGWESEHARQRFYAQALPRYEAIMRQHGGRIEPFVERTLVDVDRYPRESYATRPAIRAGQTPTD